MKARLALLLFVLPLPVLAADATPFDRDMARLTHGLPPRVRALIHREADCNHWAGEEGYDPARIAQINAAVETLKCAALDADEARLKQRYAHSAHVLRALKKARDLFAS
jgi:hypothetical protein